MSEKMTTQQVMELTRLSQATICRRARLGVYKAEKTISKGQTSAWLLDGESVRAVGSALNTRDVAKIFDVPLKVVQDWLKERPRPFPNATRAGSNGHWRIPSIDVKALLEERNEHE